MNAPSGTAGERSGEPGAVTVRRGTQDDLAFVRDLGARTIPETASSLRPAEPAAFVRAFETTLAYILTQKHTVLVAEDAFERLGFIVGLDEFVDETTGEPQGFYVFMGVEPHARRRGIARKLMLAAEDAVRASGKQYMSFAVTEDNVGARELYAQLGFSTERRLMCKRV